MDAIFSGFSDIDDDFYDEIEEILVMGDIGINATTAIIANLKQKVKEQHIKNPQECKELLINSIKEQMQVGETAYEFEHRTSELVDLSMHMMQIIAVGYIAMAVTQSLSGVMRGAGDTMTPMWISLITTVVIRVPLAYGIAYLTRSAQNPGGIPECIFISLLGSWLIGAILTALFYKGVFIRYL